MINCNYPLQHSRNLFCHLQLLVDYLQLVQHEKSISYQLDNKEITINQNNNNTSNTDDIHSFVTPRKKNYSVQATSTTTHFLQLNATLSISPVELHRTKTTPFW